MCLDPNNYILIKYQYRLSLKWPTLPKRLCECVCECESEWGKKSVND